VSWRERAGWALLISPLFIGIALMFWVIIRDNPTAGIFMGATLVWFGLSAWLVFGGKKP
jgi:hypothetical protein